MTPEDFIQESVKTQNALAALARELSGTKVPEFSSDPMTVKDASKLIGIPEESVRAGIIYGWLPIGVATSNGKEIHKQYQGRANFIIFPRKVWEVTGHVWKGKGQA